MAELTGTYKTLEERNLALAGQAHQLEQLDRFRQRVLANVSHELRTPLTAVLGFSSLLRGKTLSEKNQGYLEAIHAAGSAAHRA